MAFLAFLWIDGIKGESQDTHHLGDIDVLSYSYGVSGGNQAASARAGDHVNTKASLADLSVVKKTDGTSAALFQACASGQHFPTMILSIERDVGGRSAGEYLRYVMRDVTITSFRPGGSSRTDQTPLEEISLSFASIEWRYKKD